MIKIKEIEWQDCTHEMDRPFDKRMVDKINELVRHLNQPLEVTRKDDA